MLTREIQIKMETVNIPIFNFNIGDHITEKNPDGAMDYIIYDISYSLADRVWAYRYKYWEGGYEHYCKSSVEFVESNFINRCMRGVMQ